MKKIRAALIWLVILSVSCFGGDRRGRFSVRGSYDARYKFNQTPRQLDDLICEYDPNRGVTESGGTISAWADQSDNGHDLGQRDSQTFPTIGSVAGLNGKAIIFDGALDGNALTVSFGTTYSQATTIYILVYIDEHRGVTVNSNYIIDGDDSTDSGNNTGRHGLFFKTESLQAFAGFHLDTQSDITAGLSGAPSPRDTTHITVTPDILPSGKGFDGLSAWLQNFADFGGGTITDLTVSSATDTTYEVPFTGGITAMASYPSHDTSGTSRMETIVTGTWFDLVCVYDGENSFLYQDGVLIADRGFGSSTIGTNAWSGINMGVRNFNFSAANIHLKGKIGGMFAFNHASSESERKQMRAYLRRYLPKQ